MKKIRKLLTLHHSSSGVALLVTYVYCITIVLLFFYTFTQVDLSLTLSRWSPEQVAEKFFQHIGFFDRPLSTYLYCGIVLLLFSCYICLLYLSAKNALSKKQIWILIFFTATILLFSYNAFSYDIFNYIFDARILVNYHQNPYLFKALDFPHDHMLSFMRWTHRTYPYGPAWLFLTVPLSFAGAQIFLITFFLFKALAAICWVGTAYFIAKITNKYLKNDSLFVLSFFCFNPLVIIESLVSAHIDIVMMFFSVWSTYYLLNNKYFRSIFMLIFSVLIKFGTVFLIPVYIGTFFSHRNKKEMHLILFSKLAVFFLIISVVAESWRSQFQPWYLLALYPYAAFISRKYYILLPGILFPFFALLEYVPFLYTGNWNPPIPIMLNVLTGCGLFLSFITIFITYIRNHLFSDTAAVK